MLLPDEQTASAASSSSAAADSISSSAASAPPASSGGPVPFRSVPSTFAEDLPHSAHPTAASYACATSLAKAKEVWARVSKETDVLIAADTVVVRDGQILEKPGCE